MNFLEIRNRIIQCLSEYLQCPIMLNNQQNPEAEYPYLFYSAAPYTPEGGQGDYQLEKLDDGYLEKRTGEASCTFSFTGRIFASTHHLRRAQDRSPSSQNASSPAKIFSYST